MIAPAPVLGGPLRVLVVDDDEDACYLLAELLSHAGHDVRTANDGVGGLAAFQQFSPEVVVLDIELPDVSGYELARRIRGLPGADKARLLALSGYATPSEPGTDGGFDAHLLKPVDLRTLLRHISELRL